MHPTGCSFLRYASPSPAPESPPPLLARRFSEPLVSSRLLSVYPDRMPIRALETNRLLLRPLELADAEQTQHLFPKWEIVKFLANLVPWPYPEDGALVHYRDDLLPAVARGERWAWSLRLKSAPAQLIGSISLMTKTNNRGFWLGLPWQGQGLMSEAAKAVTDYWFDELGFPVLRVPKAAANTASRRISEKQGMRVVAVEERDYVGGRFLTEIWEITAEEWQARKARV